MRPALSLAGGAGVILVAHNVGTYTLFLLQIMRKSFSEPVAIHSSDGLVLKMLTTILEKSCRYALYAIMSGDTDADGKTTSELTGAFVS